MKRLIIAVLLLQLGLFVYTMGQLELIKGSFQAQFNDKQGQINDLRGAIKLEAKYIIEKK